VIGGLRIQVKEVIGEGLRAGESSKAAALRRRLSSPEKVTLV